MEEGQLLSLALYASILRIGHIEVRSRRGSVSVEPRSPNWGAIQLNLNRIFNRVFKSVSFTSLNKAVAKLMKTIFNIILRFN